MSALFALTAQAGFDGNHMGGWGWLLVVAMMGGMGWMMWSMMRGGRGDAKEDPVTVLKARYARGELTTEEFQERLAAMDDAR